MTYSEYSRVLEMTEAAADNATMNIELMIKNAIFEHKMAVGDLDFEFESAQDDYDQDTMTKMYLEEAETFSSKVKAAWDKFVKWVKSVVDKLMKKKPTKETEKKAKEANPEGIKVPVDVKEVDKQIEKLKPLMTPAYMKRLMKDTDRIAKKGIKINVKVSGKVKNRSVNSSTLMDHLLSGSNNLLAAIAKPAVCIVGVTGLVSTIAHAIDFTAMIQKCVTSINEWGEENIPTPLIPIFRKLMSSLSGFTNALSSKVHGGSGSNSTESGSSNASGAGTSSNPEKLNTVLIRAAKNVVSTAKECSSETGFRKKAKHALYARAVSTFRAELQKSKNIGSFSEAKFISATKTLSETGSGEDAAMAEISKIPTSTDATTESTLLYDDTVFSDFFESSDVNSDDLDDTLSFLESDDTNVNEMMNILSDF